MTFFEPTGVLRVASYVLMGSIIVPCLTSQVHGQADSVSPAISATDDSYRMTLSPDERFIVSYGYGKSLTVWSSADKRFLRRFSAFDEGATVNEATYIGDGTIVASAANDRRVVTIDARNGSRVSEVELQMGQNTIEALQVAPTGDRVFTSGSNWQHAAAWDLTTGKLLYNFLPPGVSAGKRTRIRMVPNGLQNIALSPNGNVLAGVESTTFALMLFDARTGKLLTEINAGPSHFRAATAPPPKSTSLEMATT